VKTAGPGTALHGVKIMLNHFVDGRLRVYHWERLLAFTDYGTDPAEDEKTIDARVDAIIPAQQRPARQAIEEAV